MTKLKYLAGLASLALVTISALLVAPLFRPAEAQGGNSILMTAELLNHVGVGGEPSPDVLSSCSGITTFPVNTTNNILARFTGDGPNGRVCLNDIDLPNKDGVCDGDDICLVGGSIHAIRNKNGAVTSARLFFWDDAANKYSTNYIEGVTSDPAVPMPDSAHPCFTVHVDRAAIDVIVGEKLGKNSTVVGSISMDDWKACLTSP